VAVKPFVWSYGSWVETDFNAEIAGIAEAFAERETEACLNTEEQGN
jgi:hypothetical protein